MTEQVIRTFVFLTIRMSKKERRRTTGVWSGFEVT